MNRLQAPVREKVSGQKGNQGQGIGKDGEEMWLGGTVLLRVTGVIGIVGVLVLFGLVGGGGAWLAGKGWGRARVPPSSSGDPFAGVKRFEKVA